jgi:hypothetical protein
MKTKSIITLLSFMISTLLGSIVSYASLGPEAPKELKYFVENDFDSIHLAALKTHAVPEKILLVSLILEGRSRGWIAKDSFDYKEMFKRAGLHYPKYVTFNSKRYAWKNEILPIGLVQKAIGFGVKANIQIANLSCVACHSGASFDSFGKKLEDVVIGAPSDTFNPEVYVTLLYEGMKKVNQDWSVAYKMMKKLFPETSLREKIIFQTLIKSQIKSFMKKTASVGRATPFINGGPGLTNGVASLKNVLGLDVSEGSSTGFTSIPSLGDRGFRTSLLYDGVYSNYNQESFSEVKVVTDKRIENVATVVALFTIPTMGQTPKRALKNIGDVVKLIGPILKSYKTAPFPGKVVNEKALHGYTLYNNNCLQCHGEYLWDGSKKAKLLSFPNKLVLQQEMNSDPQRWLSVSDSLVKEMEQSVWNKTLSINQTKGYVAPILEGLWSSAPYMHNGSIPTLWAFMRPEKRPASFNVGNQNLDMDHVGIENSANQISEIYDTTKSGRGNQGHAKEFENLSEDDKDDLLEFLKTL